MANAIPQQQPSSSSLTNSLCVIKGLAENYLKKTSAAQSAQPVELVERANTTMAQTLQEANRIIQMIHHFRSLTSSPEPGPATLINDCVNQVLHAMQYEFPLRNITILKILPHDLDPAPINPEHLETILFELIYFARQSLGENNGIITIEASEKMYLSRQHQSERRFVIRVAHSGAPVAKENIPFVFDAFFPAPNDDSGNNLGLFIVKRIVEYNGGTVRVETSSQQTTFFVELPAL